MRTTATGLATVVLLHAVFVFSSTEFALAQPGVGDLVASQGRLTQDLSGYRWKVKGMPPGEGIKQGLHEMPPTDIETHGWLPAQVPGDVYTDLWKAGVIEDPYWGRNSVKLDWVSWHEWWYAIQFNVSEKIKGKIVRLEFDGVDYSCDVWLNGHYLGRHEGSLSPFAFEVTGLLNCSPHWLKGRNILVVKLDPPPHLCSRVVGLKVPWFGDYWRGPIPFGIWRPVRLVACGPVRIDDVYVKPLLRDDGSADVELQITVENHTSRTTSVAIDITLRGKNFESSPYSKTITAQVSPGKKTLQTTIHIDKPQLWWPWDLGKPNLYLAKVRVKEAEQISDETTTTFGIRRVEVVWNPGFTKDEVSFPRTVRINGKTHFIRSACWGGPPDIFVGRTSLAEYRKLIQMAKAANMNNLRIFGWHPPEIPEFYQMCDELGITVWQDVIPIGTSNIPKDPAKIERIYQEAEMVIRRLRNHPCLILLEGGEEAFFRTLDPAFTKQFLEELGRRIRRHTDLPYVPDSPLTDINARSVGYKPKEALHANAYFYSMGRWLMEEWFSSLDYPIVPEMAITSVPSVESLKKFIPADELWPPGPSWGHHWADLQRLRMQNFDTFDDEMTSSLEQFVNATQDAQGTIFQLAIEHFRRNKPRTSGVSICHYITYWPDMKWGIVDAYQCPKRSYYYVRRAYQPVLVSLKFERRRWKHEEEFTGQLWVINDTYETHTNCQITVEFYDDQKQRLAQKTFRVASITPDSAQAVADLQWPVDKQVKKYFYVTLLLHDANGKQLSQNQYMFLIGDQNAARKRMQEMRQQLSRLDHEFDYSNYYRHYPLMIGEDGLNWETKLQIPRARGFGDDN